MAGVGRRIRNLEGRIEPLQEEPSGSYQALKAVLEEQGRLKASCAVHYRAGAPIEPEHIPRQILGPGYTHGELLLLAAERAAEGGAFPLEEAPAAAAALQELFENAGKDFEVLVEWEREEL